MNSSFMVNAMQAEIPSMENDTDKICWFVMRDLKRTNAKQPAYKLFEELKIEFFIPMVWKLVTHRGKRTPEEVPFMQDLLFVHDSRKNIDPIVARTETLQYRYLHGVRRTVMTVRDVDMERFKKAVESTDSPRFYRPGEIKPSMIGKKYASWEAFWMVMRDVCKNCKAQKSRDCSSSFPIC